MGKREKILVLIEHIERELAELKRLAMGEAQVSGGIGGLWRGIQVDEELFRRARASLFRPEPE